MPHRASPLSGILMALAAFALFSTHDVVVKMLGGSYAVFQVVFFSVLLTFPMTVVILLSSDATGNLRPRHPRWSMARTAAAVTTGLCVFYAFSTLPLAQVYAIIFAMPLIITVLSIPILGEKVGPHRWGAVVVGLAGVLIVLRPGSAPLEWGHLAALCGAFTGAFASVVVRRIGREERTMVLLLYPMVASFLVMAGTLPFVYRPVPLPDLGLWALMAVCALAASLLMIGAYRRADAVLVAPMQYSQIIWAAIFGWVFFDETVDLWTGVGAGVIVASGLYIVFREGRGASQQTPVLRTRTRAETATSPRVGPMLTEAERDAGLTPR
ncbi:DMT family transporter [Jannaschia aquimarina]|uniref:EamA-like transporter family protein n=1 Tax=Jannaschia aquimarina TaxID=935700 RepID=A0A0D1CKL5_9RHOB|nr:DMT family transporter [Jannaschia aquimarina]KIT15297.1 EamA-like transporter family protein [Jannaschia aquimarina]SNT25157.1 S-adenosylmethionine uptake transporter [Jannaschia aquimarina]